LLEQAARVNVSIRAERTAAVFFIEDSFVVLNADKYLLCV
jgi:hypothetical protein